MVKVIYPYQNILFNKRNSDILENVDWLSWNLKKEKNSLHELNVNLMYPDDWINEEGDTGLKCTLGDEVGLWASWGENNLDQIKRFGGYISSIEGSLGGTTELSFVVKDYKYALKNKIVFQDYYKTMPISVGNYKNYIGKLYNRDNLHDIIVDLTNMCGFTDTSLLEPPYPFTIKNNTFPRTVGSNSYSYICSGLGTPPPATGIHWVHSDTEAILNTYSNTEGYDLYDYPYLGIGYHHPMSSNAKYGFRFKINGSYYYLGWFASLTNYSGNYIGGIKPVKTKNFETTVIPVMAMMDNYYPSDTYKVTQIDLCSKNSNGIYDGRCYIDHIRPLDQSQYLINKSSYNYNDAYTLANIYASSCGHYFDITPFKQPILYNLQDKISDLSIIEGYNVITAKSTFADDSFVNNYLVISNLTDKKASLGQAVDLDSIYEHGEYMRVVESDKTISSTDKKTINTLLTSGSKETKEEAISYLQENGYLTPSLTVTVFPDFGFEEGDIIYCYLPSLGIERSLEILSVNMDYTGKCELTLGNPPSDLVSYLKKLEKIQKISIDRTIQTFDGLQSAKDEAKFTGAYNSPKGKITISGHDLIETGVDILNDIDSEGNYVWFEPDTCRDSIIIDEEGILLNDFDEFELRLPIGIATNNDKFGSIYSVRIYYTCSGITPTPDPDGINMHSLRLEQYWYSEYDPNDPGKNLIYENSTLAPGYEDGDHYHDIIVPGTVDIDPLSYYHLITGFGAVGIVGGSIKITKIEIIYNSI